MTNIGGPQIRRLQPADAALYREIRLEALQKNPEAFGSTFEKENAQPLSWFEAAIGRADIFGGFLDERLMGIAGFAAQEGAKHAHKGLLWRCMSEALRENPGLGKYLSRPCSIMRAGAWKWFS